MSRRAWAELIRPPVQELMWLAKGGHPGVQQALEDYAACWELKGDDLATYNRVLNEEFCSIRPDIQVRETCDCAEEHAG